LKLGILIYEAAMLNNQLQRQSYLALTSNSLSSYPYLIYTFC